MLKQRFVPHASDAQVSAKLIRTALLSMSDPDIIALIVKFEASDTPLNGDVENWRCNGPLEVDVWPVLREQLNAPLRQISSGASS